MHGSAFCRLDANSSPLVTLIKKREWLKNEVENLETTVGQLAAAAGLPHNLRCQIGLAEVDGITLSTIPVDADLTRQLFEAELVRVKALYTEMRSRITSAERAAQC